MIDPFYGTLFSGLAINFTYDQLKTLWQKMFARTPEEEHLEILKKVIETDPRFKEYQTNEEGLSRVVSWWRDKQISFSRLDEAEFAKQLASTMHKHQVLSFKDGGNPPLALYQRWLRSLLPKFRQAVRQMLIEREEAFRESRLNESDELQALLQIILTEIKALKEANAAPSFAPLPPPPPNSPQPDQIVAALTDMRNELVSGNLVLFCGPELSSLDKNRLPTPLHLAHKLAQSVNLTTEHNPNSLADIAEAYTTTWGRNRLIRDIISHFAKPYTYRPHLVHTLIARLPVRDIITTAWDDLLRKALEETAIDHEVIFSDGQLPYSENRTTKLYKLFGSLGNAESMIITSDDYYNLTKPPRKEVSNAIKSLLEKNTVLFVGFDLTNPDPLKLYPKIIDKPQPSQPRRYIIQTQTEKSSYWEEKWGMKVIQADLIYVLNALQLST